MKTKEITPHQYAELRCCSNSNVSKHIRNENMGCLPFVISIKNWGRFYTLEVPEDLTADSFSEFHLKKQ